MNDIYILDCKGQYKRQPKICEVKNFNKEEKRDYKTIIYFRLFTFSTWDTTGPKTTRSDICSELSL